MMTKIPCRASPWWTRHRPLARQWAPARSSARPAIGRESFDVTPSSITDPCFFLLFANKHTTERSPHSHTPCDESQITSLSNGSSTLRPKLNTQDLLPCRRRRTNWLQPKTQKRICEARMRSNSLAPSIGMWYAGAIGGIVIIITIVVRSSSLLTKTPKGSS